MFDFIDVGSSKGGSVEFCIAKFGKNGYGIDIDARKVAQAREAGFDVRPMSIDEVTDKAKWCSALHVIEHLHSRAEAVDMLRHMKRIGCNLYVTLPYFDSDGYLYKNGLKPYWSDWRGHRYQPSSLELHNIIRDFGWKGKVEFYKPILHSNEPDIIPLSAPIDSMKYDPSMGKKKEMKLEGVYREVRIWI